MSRILYQSLSGGHSGYYWHYAGGTDTGDHHLKTGFRPAGPQRDVLILTCAKHLYHSRIMHLRHEIKNLIMTIAVPATLFIWFLISFLWDR